MKNNHLDKLVQEKYKFRPSGYYKKYQELGISLSNSEFTLENKENTDFSYILDDDHCPKCELKGYITEEYGVSDCIKCYLPICEKCSECNDLYDYVCFFCSDINEPSDETQNLS